MIYVTHKTLSNKIGKQRACSVMEFLRHRINPVRNRETLTHVRCGKEVERFIHVDAFPIDEALQQIDAHVKAAHKNMNAELWVVARSAIEGMKLSEKETA